MKSIKTAFFLAVFSLIFSTSCTNKLETLKTNQEFNYELTSEDELPTTEVQKSIELFYKNGTEGTFSGAENIPIYYKVFRHGNPTSKAIFISSGRTESAIKYKEIAYDLYRNGFDIYIHDHRGQGLSGRMAEDRELGYVDSFANYIIDMKTFYTLISEQKKYDNLFLLGHSMGGAIGLNYLENYPNDFSAAAFSSPMLGLNFIQCTLADSYKEEKPDYAPTQKGYESSKETFKSNTLTNSENRFEVFKKAYHDEPMVRLGGVSLHWVDESCRYMQTILENSFKIKTPSLIFSAEEEEIVIPEAHVTFVEKCIAENGPVQGYYVKNAKHELLIEKDKTRTAVVGTILDFFESF